MLTPLRHKLTAQVILFRSLARNPKFWLVIFTDILLLILAHYLAYVIRFADTIHGRELVPFSSLMVLLISVKIPVFYALGLYRGMWRYTSYSDVFNVLKGTISAAAIVIMILLYANRFQGYSRSVFILDTLLTFILITGHRVAIRYFYNSMHGPRKLTSGQPASPQEKTAPGRRRRLGGKSAAGGS